MARGRVRPSLNRGTSLHHRWRKTHHWNCRLRQPLEQIVRARYEAGHSQRAIARELNIDRRKVKRILDQAA